MLKMKVLLLKDVYKLGRAGDVKKVANGYGRNFLIPQGLATLATPGSLKQIEMIQKRAAEQRAILNNEMSGVAEKLAQLTVTFASKAGETGKLYGSITTQMIADAINEKLGLNIDRRDVETQPIRLLGEHKALVRLTVDLVPEIKILVHREGEAVSSLYEAVTEVPVVEEVVVDEEAEVASEE
ncbi:MAG: 50S ribosomal protein L9 [Anaerolineaceae bacterium]|nr:50S ribosomal protein L9 [Anaerolineaceae bacterium]